MELWDIYDESFMKTGRVHRRGEPLAKGDYHLAVNIYPVNSRGEVLIQKRSNNISWKPGIWAATGGSALAGEDGFTSCQRELMEELGIEATRENTSLVLVLKRSDKYMYVYLVSTDITIDELKLQPEEVADAKWVTKEELRSLVEAGEFYRYHYLEHLYEFLTTQRDNAER